MPPFFVSCAHSAAIYSTQLPASLQGKKDPTLRTLEARLRNARYLGELVKFRLAPFGTIFVILKVRAALHVHLASLLPMQQTLMYHTDVHMDNISSKHIVSIEFASCSRNKQAQHGMAWHGTIQ